MSARRNRMVDAGGRHIGHVVTGGVPRCWCPGHHPHAVARATLLMANDGACVCGNHHWSSVGLRAREFRTALKQHNKEDRTMPFSVRRYRAVREG